MRAFTLLVLGAVAATSTGCMSGMKSSDGTKTFTYDCSGLGNGWGDCNEKADAQCGVRNYTIVSQNGDVQDKGGSGNTEMKRTLVVSCKHER
ncbi:MAG: hypothetical protein WBV39_14115 [Rudaea sp.]